MDIFIFLFDSMFALIPVSWILFYVLQFIWKKQDDEFCGFLNDNREEIMNGGSCEYRGNTYSKYTEVTRFVCCTSVIILTSCRSSRMVPAEKSAGIRALCIIISLIGGWWGIPWGPIKTVQAIYKCIAAEKFTLFDLYTRGN